MKTNPFFSQFCHAPILRLAVVMLVGMALCSGCASNRFENAVTKGDFEKAKVLLKNHPELVVRKDKEGRTPLHMVAVWDDMVHGYWVVTGKETIIVTSLSHDKAVAKMLLANGADINARDNDGETPLFLAVKNDNLAPWAGFALANLAEFKSEMMSDSRPLHNAVMACRTDVLDLLLTSNADVNISDNEGNTPLHITADKHVAELLLAHGANVNAKAGKMGLTPLHLAAQFDRKDVAVVLLAHGADVNAKSEPVDNPIGIGIRGGITPLELAVMNHHKDMEDLLRQHGGTNNPNFLRF